MLDLRFPTALQAMLSLALAEESGVSRVTSAELAEGLGANPSLVRRLLRQLVNAGLLVSVLGKSGGLGLARPASAISLAEVYAAATEGRPLWMPRDNIPHRCIVTSNVEAYFTELARDADEAVTGTLAKSSLADALAQIKLLDHRRIETRNRQPAKPARTRRVNGGRQRRVP